MAQLTIEQAVDLHRRAIAVNPYDVEAQNELAIALSGQGKLEEAISTLSHAIRLCPDAAPLHFNLGTLRARKGWLDEAIAAYRQALRLRPAYPTALNNLGNALREKGQTQEAINAFSEALRIDPASHEACNNLGMTLASMREFDQALMVYQRAIQLKPASSVSHYNLALAFKALGRLDEAIASYSKAIELEPGNAEALNNLGNALKECGKLTEALGCFDRAIALRPERALFHSNRLFTLHCIPNYSAAELFTEHRRWNERHAIRLARPASEQAYSNARTGDRRLRIGYVSPDFHAHPVGRFLLPLLQHHDRQAVEVYCYGDMRADDEITQRLRRSADALRNITGMTDDQCAGLVRQDRIDILVDLAGHTAQSRLLLFARKPAPLQVTYLGYPDTTGMTAMDYRITDAHADPPGTGEQFYSEHLHRLPHGFLCCLPADEPIPIGPLHATARGHITFGSFNGGSKFNASIVGLWARILRRIGNAKLLIKYRALSSNTARAHLSGLFAAHGIGVDRLDLRSAQASHEAHLRVYDQVDIALDTFPYHGTMTTCEALWMGVPVITLAGQTHVSRVGVSILSNVGLTELIAQSEDQYVEIAATLAADLPRLAVLRANLRQRMQQSPLMDAPRYARDIEAAYRRMWLGFCQGKTRAAEQ